MKGKMYTVQVLRENRQEKEKREEQYFVGDRIVFKSDKYTYTGIIREKLQTGKAFLVKWSKDGDERWVRKEDILGKR